MYIYIYVYVYVYIYIYIPSATRGSASREGREESHGAKRSTCGELAVARKDEARDASDTNTCEL